MALDNAEFIAELSIVDPPGTDPLNQGDDHLRTIKKAVQQSFPNVGSAVPQTGAQMAQMAIKNEANLFTAINTFNTTSLFNGHLRAANGVGATPVYSFQNDNTTGMFLVSPGVLGISTGVTARLTLQGASALWDVNQQLNFGGVAGAPAYSFSADPTTGMYRIQANDIGWDTGGVRRMRLRSTEMELTVPIRGQFGSVSAPSYSFDTEESTGMFRGAAGSLWFGTLGRTRLKLSDTGRNSFLQATATGGVSLSLETNTSIIAYSIDFEGTAGFQPGQFSISRFNRTTGAFIDIPLYINASTGRVHSKLPILTP